MKFKISLPSIPEKNGLKAKNTVDYRKYLLYGVLAYIFFAFLMFHTYAYIAKDPMLPFTDALIKGIGSMSTHPLQVVAFPGSDYYQTLFVGLIAMVFGGWYLWLRQKQASELMLVGSHGTMHFNNKLDQYNRQYTDPPGSPHNNGLRNMVFTNDVFMSMDTKATRRNLNVLVVGGSGSGKSRFVVKPNLCQMPINTNFICTDPSGELMADTGKMLESFGYKVKCFNLVDMNKSDTYNPLEYIHTENDVILLVDCLLANTSDPNKKGGDDFWEKAMKLMLQSFIFLLWLHGDRLGLDKTLTGVMDLLDGCFIENGGDDDKNNSNGDDDDISYMTRTDKYFAMVQYGYMTDDNGEIVRKKNGDPIIGHGRTAKYPETTYPNKRGMDIAVKQYRKFKSSGTGKTFQNMLISASARFSNFDIQSLVDLTSSNTIDLESLGDEKTVLFVTLPQENDSFNFMAALLYSQLFQVLYYRAENNCQGNYLVKDSNGEIARVYEIDHRHRADSDSNDMYNSVDDWEEFELGSDNSGGTSDKDSKEEKKKKRILNWSVKKAEKRVKEETKKVNDIKQFESTDQFIGSIGDLQNAAQVDSAELEVDENPGNVDDKSIESEAEQFIEDLKGLKLIKSKSSELYAIRYHSSVSGKMETLGVYADKKYAVKRATALKDASLSRCGLHLPFHVRFLLDEFANIGSIPNFTKLLATMRKYELSCTIILQNLAQIKNMYDKDWGSIVGNCDSILLLGSSEYDTQEYFSKKLGKTTVKTRSTSVSHGSKGSSSQSTQQAARELMLPEEIGQMSDAECILIIRGIYPFRGLKYKYERHPNFGFTADASKDNLYKFIPGKNSDFILPTLKRPVLQAPDIQDEHVASNRVGVEEHSEEASDTKGPSNIESTNTNDAAQITRKIEDVSKPFQGVSDLLDELDKDEVLENFDDGFEETRVLPVGAATTTQGDRWVDPVEENISKEEPVESSDDSVSTVVKADESIPEDSSIYTNMSPEDFQKEYAAFSARTSSETSDESDFMIV